MVLDLDETLVHCVEEGANADVHLEIKLFDEFTVSVLSSFILIPIGWNKHTTWSNRNAVKPEYNIRNSRVHIK